MMKQTERQRKLEEARTLFKQGYKCWRIAKMVGLRPGMLYYHLHPGIKEKILARTVKWRREHPEEFKEQRRVQSRRFYYRNPDKRRAAARSWYHRNPERAQKRAAEWRKRNPERVKEQAKKHGLIRKMKRRRIMAIVQEMKSIIKAKNESSHNH